MENKLRHLEMVQAIIGRMASNSFLLKAWNVVLVSAVFAVASGESSSQLVYVAYLPATVFWLLDGYFLRQERLFRKLYDKIRFLDDSDIDFSMNTVTMETEVASWLQVAFSKTLLLFHGTVLLTVTTVWVVPIVCEYIENS